jgi:hypothetical protein
MCTSGIARKREIASVDEASAREPNADTAAGRE